MATDPSVLSQGGPGRDLWAQAAVRERFRAGDLLGQWIEAHPGVDTETVKTARHAALDLQRNAKPALGADGLPAHRLATDDRITVLRAIGPETARDIIGSMPSAERGETEVLLAALLAGDLPVSDTRDRAQLVALGQVAPMAAAAGAPAEIDTEAVRRHLDNLDFLNLLGGPDLHRFIGRADPLANLRRAWSSGKTGVALIEAPGGMGKSMLVSRFVADLLAEPGHRPAAVFHIDFDRHDLQNARPATVISEMLRQASRWVKPGKQEAVRSLAASSHGWFEEDELGQSRSLESFGFFANHRIESLIDLFDGDLRFIVIADSAEQVFGFNDLAAESPSLVVDELFQAAPMHRSERRPQVMLVWAARHFPTDWVDRQRVLLRVRLDVLEPDEARAYLRAEAARAQTVVPDDTLEAVIEAVGRSPLALRLAARLLAGEAARADPWAWVEAARNDPERVQATLHDRVLKRLRDPDLRKLASPGLLLRRLTPDIVRQVLAGPCELVLDKKSARRLIAASAGEGQLFFRDVSDPDQRAVWHRPDVRALMLPNLESTIDPQQAAAINEAAVAYYAQHDDDVSRAEELYHRLRLDQANSDLMPRWTAAAGERLRRAVDEFPPRARDLLRNQLGAATVADLDEGSEGTDIGPEAIDPQAMETLRRVIRRELQRGAPPLDVLVRYNVDDLNGMLGDVYAEALVQSGQLTALLDGARALLARIDVALPGIRASILATAAGVLEGQGKLSEALPYWAEARALSYDPDDDEAALRMVGFTVGWLRNSRKLGLVDGRSDTLEALARWADRHASTLVARSVLLRELTAELGDTLGGLPTEAAATCRRLVSVLFSSGEAFPSAVADHERSQALAQQLVGENAAPQNNLASVAEKLIYTGTKSAGRVVHLLRQEVEWTLAKAISRPSSEPP